MSRNWGSSERRGLGLGCLISPGVVLDGDMAHGWWARNSKWGGSLFQVLELIWACIHSPALWQDHRSRLHLECKHSHSGLMMVAVVCWRRPFGWLYHISIDHWHRTCMHCRGVPCRLPQHWHIHFILGKSIMSGGGDKERTYTTHQIGLPRSGSLAITGWQYSFGPHPLG